MDLKIIESGFTPVKHTFIWTVFHIFSHVWWGLQVKGKNVTITYISFLCNSYQVKKTKENHTMSVLDIM